MMSRRGAQTKRSPRSSVERRVRGVVSEAVDNLSRKTGRDPGQALQAVVAPNPPRRLVRPEEMATAVLWLCLPGRESITGQAISVSVEEVM